MFKNISHYIAENYLALCILCFALIGFYASGTLTIEKIHLIKNPNEVLPCNINGIFNCGIVMRTQYAEIFGIPSSLLGVAGYPAAGMTGLFLLEKRRLKKWLATLITIAPLGAFVLSTYWTWLSAYVIGAFCPWCLTSAISSTIIFTFLIAYHFEQNNFDLPQELAHSLQRKVRGSWHIGLLIIWFILLAGIFSIPFITGRF